MSTIDEIFDVMDYIWESLLVGGLWSPSFTILRWCYSLVVLILSHPYIQAYLLAYVVWRIALWLRRPEYSSKLSRKLLKLWKNGEEDFFYPRNVTEQGHHYATTKAGFDGFILIEGFRHTFVPTLDLYKEEVTAGSLFGYNLNICFSVERKNNYIVTIRMDSWSCNTYNDYICPNMKFVKGEVAALGYMTETECRVQLQAAPFVGCDLRLSEYDEFRFRTGSKPNMGYMEFISKGMDVPRHDIPRIATCLKEEMRVLRFEPYVQPISCGGDGDIEVTLLGKEIDVPLDAVKPLGKVLPQPYDQESVVFAVNASSENITFTERIVKYVKDYDFTWPKVYDSYQNEFLQFLVPTEFVGSGAPDDLITALEQQTRPSQVMGYEDVKDLPDPLNCGLDSSFQKGEVYPEMKAPRNIINPPPAKRVLTSTMVRPLAEYLKDESGPLVEIYGFGSADYLMRCFNKVERQDIEAGSLGKFETDGTKLDANVSARCREFEEALLLRFYAPEHHEQIRAIHRAQYDQEVPKSKKGGKVNLKASRRSGEGGTSLFNTVLMTFVLYCWLRTLGFAPKTAWKKLGVYGGDDGLTVAWGDADSLKKVGDDLGIPLKVKHVATREPFSFLGTVKLPQVDLYLPDVIRFCSKIAYSHVKGVPVEQVLYRKCEPYVRMYPNVPIVGNLCRAVLRILKGSGFRVDKRYDELCRSGQGYVITMLQGSQLPGPTTHEEFMLLEAYVCDSLGVSLGTLREVCDSYDAATTFTQFPTGYVSKENMFLSAPYEALLRDLYIPGPPLEKLVSDLPTRSLTGVQNLQRHEETTDETTTTSTTASNAGCDESGRPKKKRQRAKKKAQGDKKIVPDPSGDGLSENRALTA